MLDLGLNTGIVLVLCAFVCEYIDSTLGMGYGTTLTPIFLLMGFAPLEIVPAILLSELVSGILAGIGHHREGNADFKPQTTGIFKMSNMRSFRTYFGVLRKSFPLHLKIALLLASCSIFGTVIAVFVAVSIPRFWLKLYIGCLILSMGVVVLVCMKKNFHFSWKRVFSLGLLASFNKGMSGGGYGPVVTGGQLLAGVEGKNAVAITSLAEGLTCLVGVITYVLVAKNAINWHLAPYIVTGAVLAVPLSVKSVKILGDRTLKYAIASLTILLGVVTILRTVI